MLGRFLRQTPLRLFDAPSEDYYKFLVACTDSLYDLGLVKNRVMDYATFQLYLETQHQWRGYLESRRAISFCLIETQSCKVFYERIYLTVLEII